MGPGIAELMATVAAQGVKPAGPCILHHFAMHPDTFDFEIGVPVTCPVTLAGRVMLVACQTRTPPPGALNSINHCLPNL